MKSAQLSPLFVLILAVGCGSDGTRRPARVMSPESQAPAGAEKKEAAGGEQARKSVERKIVYTATVELVVRDLDQAEADMRRLLQETGGFVAHSEVRGSPGSPRSGTWTVRVPVGRFESFREAILQLGVPQRDVLDSRDVTEEYYDTEARLRNKKKTEERLLQHLKESTGKLEDVLLVEKELGRVREEAEQLEGRLRLLTNLTDLTTVTVSFREERDYTPPQAPTFGQQIGETFGNSLRAMGDAGKELVLVVVAVAPWLSVPGVILLVVWLAVRLRRMNSAPTRTPPPVPPTGADQ